MYNWGRPNIHQMDFGHVLIAFLWIYVDEMVKTTNTTPFFFFHFSYYNIIYVWGKLYSDLTLVITNTTPSFFFLLYFLSHISFTSCLFYFSIFSIFLHTHFFQHLSLWLCFKYCLLNPVRTLQQSDYSVVCIRQYL